jgi:hypothetical protein
MYRVYKVKKGKGGYRTITEPSEALKPMLTEVKELLDLVPLSEHAHGFVPNRSPYTNAMQHRARAYVLNIDLKDFFPSVKQGRMMTVLRKTSMKSWRCLRCCEAGAIQGTQMISPSLEA